MVLNSLYDPTCLYASLTILGHVHYEMCKGVPGDLNSDLNQGITERLDNPTCNLVVSNGLKHNVLEAF